MPAQGELRGPRINDTLKTSEPEAQYLGGDAAAIHAKSDAAAAVWTVNKRTRNRALADQNLHEVWTRQDNGDYALAHYKDATTGKTRDFIEP